ncbi:hypothetical protein OG579_07555 [Williamsia herbipolensis]|uniref:Mce-associated membrane protein n=1 Tax=Williamsia herbipolensis TaxID=1603258 RepID=A0AAU4K6Q7_9NOCA|nr:hypothetical protein [Williamsia herbipolensis]
MSASESARVTAARERLERAEAAVAATEVHTGPGRSSDDGGTRRTRRVAVLIAIVVVVAATVAGIVVCVFSVRADDERGRAEAVVAATRAAVATVLTADPTDPEGYLASVRRVSSGDFLRRIDDSAAEITAAVAAQRLPGTGQVVAAGVVGDAARSPVDLLVVAEATNPALLGGSATDGRLVLDVRMIHGARGWTIDRAQLR